MKQALLRWWLTEIERPEFGQHNLASSRMPGGVPSQEAPIPSQSGTLHGNYNLGPHYSPKHKYTLLPTVTQLYGASVRSVRPIWVYVM